MLCTRYRSLDIPSSLEVLRLWSGGVHQQTDVQYADIYIAGLILASPECNACAGRAGRHDRSDNDDFNVEHKFSVAKDLLR